jgi:uncharacterized repeat protein (TIGR01451 family)
MGRSRLRKIGVAAAAAAAALTGLAVSSAAAATVNPGTLKVSPGSVSAGSVGGVLTLGYTAPAKGATGTVSITVPAGFSAPQDTSPGGAGYLSASSACARFQVTGIAPGAGGAATVTLAVSCAAKQAGTVIYQDVTAPTAVGAYPFATAFTPAGSQTPVPFAAQHQVTVKPGPLAEVVLSPATATIAPGGTQAYTARGLDAYGNARGDVTAATKFKISPNGSCTGASCTATATGPHTVTGTHSKLVDTASLTVAASPPAQADLSAAEAVSNASPFFDTSVTFTTTVTNNGPATAAGATVTVAVPSPRAPAATPAAPGRSGRWQPARTPPSPSRAWPATCQQAPRPSPPPSPRPRRTRTRPTTPPPPARRPSLPRSG